MSLSLRCLILLLILGAIPAYAVDRTVVFYVSPDGNDAWNGSAESPFRTIKRAQESIRKARGTNNGKRFIFLRGGVHELPEPIVLGESDGGDLDFPLTIKPSAGAKVTLSGGRKLTGWTLQSPKLAVLDLEAMHIAQAAAVEAKNAAAKPPWDAEENRRLLIAQARKENYKVKPYPPFPVPEKVDWDFRDLYVNEERMPRARTPNEGFWTLQKPESGPQTVFKIVEGTVLPMIANPENVELVFIENNAPVRVPLVSIDPESGTIVLETVVKFESETPEFYLENAPEFVDEPGEWCLDRTNQKVYYRLQRRELPEKLVVYAPILSQLITLTGDMSDEDAGPVKNLHFENIRFAHTTEFRKSAPRKFPSELETETTPETPITSTSFETTQPTETTVSEVVAEPEVSEIATEIPEEIIPSVLYRDSKTPDLEIVRTSNPIAAVEIRDVENCTFKGCTFEFLGGNALRIENGSKDITIENASFHDIGGYGIMIGNEESWAGTEEIRLLDARFENTALKFYGSSAVFLGHVRSLLISGCIFQNVPHSEIALIASEYESNLKEARIENAISEPIDRE